jgi:hypothetical protein
LSDPDRCPIGRDKRHPDSEERPDEGAATGENQSTQTSAHPLGHDADGPPLPFAVGMHGQDWQHP